VGAGERWRPAVGDRVRVTADDPDEFRRVPGYLRGQLGGVVAECGERPLPVGHGAREVFRDPEPVLTVRFDGGQLFGETGTGTHVHADLWLTNLEEVGAP
jgi:nitrile hydratase subunit beta